MTDTQLTRIYDLKTQGVDVVINDINKVIQRLDHLGQVKNSIFKAGTMLGVGEAFKMVNQEMQEQAAIQMQILESLKNINATTERSIGVQERMAVGLDGILMKQKSINLSMADVAKGNIQEKVIIINNELKARQALVQEMRAEKEFAAALANQEKANTEISKQATEASKQQANATLSEAKAATELSKQKQIEINYTIALTKEKERLTANADKEAATLARQQSAYYQLNNEYKEAAANAKNLGAQQAVLQREIQELATIKAPSEQITLAQKRADLEALLPTLTKAQANALGLHTALLKIDQAVGQSQRNVGNYNGAVMAMGQMLREAPAFANSFATGIMAISNNFPILIDEIQKLKAANDLAVAAGGKAIPVWKTLSQAFTSFGGIMTIAITALTFFAPAIAKFFNGTDKATDGLKEFNKAILETKQSTELFIAKEIQATQTLLEQAKDLSLSYNSRIQAINSLIQLYPELLSKMDTEAMLAGKASENMDKFTKAIQLKAQAQELAQQIEQRNKAIPQLRQNLQTAQTNLDEAGANIFGMNGDEKKKLAEARNALNDVEASADGLTNHLKEVNDQLYQLMHPKADFKSLEDLKAKLAGMQSDLGKMHLAKGINANTPASAVDGLISQDPDFGKKLSSQMTGIKQLDELIKKLEGSVRQKTGETYLKGINELFEANKRYDQAIGAQAKQEIEVRAAANKAIADDETKTLQVRMAAQQRYNEDMKALAVAEAQKDIAIIDDKLKALGDKERLYLQGRVKLTKDQLAAIRKDEETFNILRGVKMGEMKSKELELEKSGYAARLSVVQAFTKAYKDEVDKVAALALQNMDTDLANKLTALANKGGNKEVQKKTAAELAIQAEIGKAQAVKAKVNTELPTAENTLAVLEAEKEVTTDLEKRAKIMSDIRDLELEIARLKNQYANADLKEAESLAKRKEIKDADKKMLIGKMENGAIDIAQGAAEAEMAVLAARDAARDRSAEKQMSWNQKLLGAQVQSKAQQLANEKAYAAQQEEMAKEKAQRDHRRAKQQMAIEYAAAALKIVAANVWKGATGWAEIAVEEAILAGAYISKLAMLSAPAYAGGTGDGTHPGGPAIVGDGGRNEVVQVGDKYYITPATATPVDMPAGAKVFPSIPDITTMSTFNYPGTMGAQLKAPTYFANDTRGGNSAEIQGNNQMADIVAGFGEMRGSIAMIMAGLQHMDVSLDTNKLSSKLSKNLTEKVEI